MKKIISLIIIIILITGCSQSKNSDYLASINELRKASTSSNNSYAPFNIGFKVIKENEANIQYTLTLSNPKEPVYNIKVVIVHDYPGNDSYPNIGYNGKEYSLIPKVINEKSGYLKQIVLSGYIDFEGELNTFDATFKVKVEYQDQKQVSHVIYYTKGV